MDAFPTSSLLCFIYVFILRRRLSVFCLHVSFFPGGNRGSFSPIVVGCLTSLYVVSNWRLFRVSGGAILLTPRISIPTTFPLAS